MATGRRAFEGKSRASLIASILDREPPAMSSIQPMTPPSLERLVRACLAKDPDERLQTAHDVALQLRWISESSSVIEPLSIRRRRKSLPWMAAAVAAAIAVAALILYIRERDKPPSPFSLSVAPPPNSDFGNARMSPDGQTVAFVARAKDGQMTLWTRRLDDAEPKMLTKAQLVMAWSPDGRWIAFANAGKLMRIRIEGGQPEAICTTSIHSVAWSDDGTIILAPRFGMGFFTVPATGGEPKVLTKLDAARRESLHGTPVVLPHSSRFLYLVHTVASKRNEIYAGSLDGMKPKLVVEADALGGYAKPYLFFVRDGAIYAQRFDEDALRAEGEPRRVADNVTYNETGSNAGVSVSSNGVLLYSTFHPTIISINTYDRSGKFLGTLWKDTNIGRPILSKDGKTLTVVKWDPAKGALDVAMVELARGITTKITGGLANNFAPVPAADGQSLYFTSDRDGMEDIWLKTADAASPERIVWQSPFDKVGHSLSPDGKYLLATQFTLGTRDDIYAVPLTGNEKPSVLVQSERNDSDPVFSPDGKWFAYDSSLDVETEVYVRAFPSGRAVRVSTEGGTVPSWSPDGRQILYMTSGGDVMLVDVHPNGGTMEVGVPKKLFSNPEIWAVARFMPDGRIICGEAQAPTPGLLTVSTAWRSRLQQ